MEFDLISGPMEINPVDDDPRIGNIHILSHAVFVYPDVKPYVDRNSDGASFGETQYVFINAKNAAALAIDSCILTNTRTQVQTYLHKILVDNKVGWLSCGHFHDPHVRCTRPIWGYQCS